MAKISQVPKTSKFPKITKKSSTVNKPAILKKPIFSKKTKTIPEEVKKVEKPLVFWRETGQEGGFLSPWYPSPFEAPDMCVYASVGHYMMAAKAKTSGDEASLKRIRAAEDPDKQQILGSKVKGFNPEVWKTKSYEFAGDANHMKFRANADICERLLKTGDRELIDASPVDRVWGIGFVAADAKNCLNRDLWGENRFGKALMEVRSKVKVLEEPKDIPTWCEIY